MGESFQPVCPASGYESLLHARHYESRGGTTSLRVTLPLSFCDDFGGGAPRPHSRLVCDPTYRSLSATYSVALPHDCKVPISELYRVSQEERTKLRESVPYVKLYRYNPKHLYPKLNGYGDNGQRSLKRFTIQSVTGGTDQTSGECSLC